MLKVGVLVSGGGTNLQAIIDALENGKIKNAEIVTVVASKDGVYSLKRAENHGIPSCVISRKSFENQSDFDEAICMHMRNLEVDLIVMAGFLSIIGNKILSEFKNRIINIHPSLIPSFCGNGFYGLKVHEAALERGVKITGATVHFVNEITDGG
ncbi:MAG: phosphoribosylglycinamide formyltransferase, partial [Oscillospiraceae bacterium]